MQGRNRRLFRRRIGRLKHLLENVGVRRDFQVQDVMESLSKIRQRSEDKPLREDDLLFT